MAKPGSQFRCGISVELAAIEAPVLSEQLKADAKVTVGFDQTGGHETKTGVGVICGN